VTLAIAIGLQTHENRILGVEGLVKILNGEIVPSSFTNMASGQEWNKDVQARVSNAHESGVILNGKRITQRVVRWELLSAWKYPGNMDGGELEICIRRKEGHK
jgi:H2-forming N5,N10-methylenetetrahydromethanopterin dehydrogenase-like enzyme